MKRTSKELKRIARDILNDRYRVPMAAFAATTLIATVIESLIHLRKIQTDFLSRDFYFY